MVQGSTGNFLKEESNQFFYYHAMMPMYDNKHHNTILTPKAQGSQWKKENKDCKSQGTGNFL